MSLKGGASVMALANRTEKVGHMEGQSTVRL